MCGIAGVVSDEPVDRDLVAEMRDRLAHRGPDHAGLWQSDDGRVCLAHRRLAIIDLSPEANQPFASCDGRLVVTFNGEIYNFAELRRELAGHGVRFRTRSDTEVLVEAYRRWGDRCVDRLSGMFAFAIWDNHQRRLFCARDRAGEKPFYYTKIGRSFVFASELKSLLVWPGFRRTIHYPALIDYLSFGFVPDPKCIWEGSHKLAPGHRLSIEPGPGGETAVGEPVAYWDMQFEADHAVRDWRLQILDTLQTITREMAAADVPVGAFLSGGVDSSSVTAALRRADCPLATFTIGFEEPGYDERVWAREVAELYHTRHSEQLVVCEDLPRVLDKILWHFDEPFGDYSYLPTFYVCREARRRITVALSGDGADEVFAGYTKYRRLSLRAALERLGPPWLLRLGARGGERLAPESWRTGRGRLRAYRLDQSDLLFETLTIGQSPDLLRRAARGELAKTLACYSPLDAVRAHLAKAPPERVGLINAMRYLDLKLTLGSGILTKVDRTSMAHSLEVRPVYVHRDMLELAARIPPSLLADFREAKKLLKSVLRGWLPDALLYRQKQGFALPISAQWVERLAYDSVRAADCDSLGNLLDEAFVQRALQHESDTFGDQTFVGHSLFFLRSWLAKWA